MHRVSHDWIQTSGDIYASNVDLEPPLQVTYLVFQPVFQAHL